MTDPYLPADAVIIKREQQSKTIFTIDCELTQASKLQHFQPGQFNMLYFYGVGEVAISIMSDPDDHSHISHTIRNVGRVTNGLAQCQVGDHIGIRGPYGSSWPLVDALGKDLIIVTGGLGCAPVVSIINYIFRRRALFGHVSILQGIKHSDDFIFHDQYQYWRQQPDTTVYIAADKTGPQWPFSTGHVTDFLDQITIEPSNAVAMMCGPEAMMKVAVNSLLKKNIQAEDIYLSMERNMHCAIAHCGHCQYGAQFVCKDGPIFSYDKIHALFNVAGY